MAIRKESVGQQIRRILRASGKLDTRTGMLYQKREQLTRHYHAVTMFALFVSDEETFLLRPHVFESIKTKRNALAWRAWFKKNYGKILRENILPGMGNRTDKQWRLYRIIGWVPGAKNDRHGSSNSSARKPRNKTKRQGRKNGRIRSRR
jgi:hypothetical protein